MNWFNEFLDTLIKKVGVLPTTQLRMLITYCLAIATGTVYLILAIKVQLFGLHVATPTQAKEIAALLTTEKSWEPSIAWLSFLTIMSGLDAMQFGMKRTTDVDYITAKQNTTTTATTVSQDSNSSTASTDIQELSQNNSQKG